MNRHAIQIIRSRMRDLGLGVRELAKQSFVGTSFVYDILSGKSKNPTMQKLSSVSKVLSIPVSELIDSEGSSNVLMKEFVPIYHLNQDKSASPKLMINVSALNSVSSSQNLYFYNVDNNFNDVLSRNDTVIIDIGRKSGAGTFLVREGFNIEIKEMFDKYNSEANDNKDDSSVIGKILWLFRSI